MNGPGQPESPRLPERLVESFILAVAEPGTNRHGFAYFDREAEIADDGAVLAASALNRGVGRCVRAFPTN